MYQEDSTSQRREGVSFTPAKALDPNPNYRFQKLTSIWKITIARSSYATWSARKKKGLNSIKPSTIASFVPIQSRQNVSTSSFNDGTKPQTYTKTNVAFAHTPQSRKPGICCMERKCIRHSAFSRTLPAKPKHHVHVGSLPPNTETTEIKNMSNECDDVGRESFLSFFACRCMAKLIIRVSCEFEVFTFLVKHNSCFQSVVCRSVLRVIILGNIVSFELRRVWSPRSFKYHPWCLLFSSPRVRGLVQIVQTLPKLTCHLT